MMIFIYSFYLILPVPDSVCNQNLQVKFDPLASARLHLIFDFVDIFIDFKRRQFKSNMVVEINITKQSITK